MRAAPSKPPSSSFLPTSKHLQKFKLVTLDNLYSMIENELAQRLFMQMMAVKAKGYGPPDYPAHTMPIEATDFIARHHIFCFEEVINNQILLTPVGGFKQAVLTLCDHYFLTPPYLSLAKAAKSGIQAKELEAIFAEHRNNGKPLFCASGFTLNRQVRKADREFSEFAKEFVAALMYFDSLGAGGATIIGAGAPRFKTEALWEKVGFHRLKTTNGIDLDPLFLPQADEEKLLLMRLDHFTEWAKECFVKHQRKIESRILLDSNSTQLHEAA